MTRTYHKLPALCTANVPSPFGTPALDGFLVKSGHRAANGNVHWALIWPDFARFLGLSPKALENLPWNDINWHLAVAALKRGYDPKCVLALKVPAGRRSDALTAAAALGFDPAFLWPVHAHAWSENRRYRPNSPMIRRARSRQVLAVAAGLRAFCLAIARRKAEQKSHYTAQELAELRLDGLPIGVAQVRRMARAQGWRFLKLRPRQDRRSVRFFIAADLPAEAQADLGSRIQGQHSSGFYARLRNAIACCRAAYLDVRHDPA